MEEEILDSITPTTPRGTDYSQLSFLSAIATFALFIIIFALSEITIAPPLSAFFRPPTWGLALAILSVTLGLVMTVRSFLRKEPGRWYKYVGAALNVLQLIILLGLVSYLVWSYW